MNRPAGPLSVARVTDAATDKHISITPEHPEPGTTVLRISGEVDMLTSPVLREALSDHLASGAQRLVLDLNDVPFMGTSGLAVLVEARAGALDKNIDLWLVCTKRATLRSLDVAGLRPLFQVADTVTQALAT